MCHHISTGLYSSTLSLTSALDGVDGQRHAPAALPPGKDTVPIVEEVGWASEPVCTSAENLAPTRIRSPDRPARSESLYRLRYPCPPLRDSKNYFCHLKRPLEIRQGIISYLHPLHLCPFPLSLSRICFHSQAETNELALMFIGPCIIVIVEE